MSSASYVFHTQTSGTRPNLQSLVYDCKEPPDSVLILPDLQLALGHVRNTLTKLVIRSNPDIGPLSGFALVAGTLVGYLGWLAGLEDLEIPLGVLYGLTEPQSAPPLSNVFPAGLKRLTINNDLWQGQSLTSSLWRFEPSGALLKAFFSGAWKSATPLLEEFVLDLRNNGKDRSREYWGRKEIREELQELVESQGMRCSVHWDANREPYTMASVLE